MEKKSKNTNNLLIKIGDNEENKSNMKVESQKSLSKSRSRLSSFQRRREAQDALESYVQREEQQLYTSYTGGGPKILDHGKGKPYAKFPGGAAIKQGAAHGSTIVKSDLREPSNAEGRPHVESMNEKPPAALLPGPGIEKSEALEAASTLKKEPASA